MRELIYRDSNSLLDSSFIISYSTIPCIPVDHKTITRYKNSAEVFSQNKHLVENSYKVSISEQTKDQLHSPDLRQNNECVLTLLEHIRITI